MGRIISTKPKHKMTTTIKTKPCKKCAEPFEFTEYEDFPNLCSNYCKPCAAVLEAEHTAKIAAEEFARDKWQRDNQWSRICPLRFLDTDESRLPKQSLDAIAAWNPDESMNLAFLGIAGTCKTRAGFLALKKANDSGAWCESITHSKLTETARDAAYGDDTDDARKRMRKLENCAVLFVDDLGKPPSTERADADFEALIDLRYSHGRPTIWTANSGGAWLASRFGADRGEPIIRRLAEDALIVKL